MKITILGCGTSTGVPVLLCRCSVCRSKHPKNKRLRTSIWIQNGQQSIVVDTSIDFRQQAMRARITHLDAVLLTHPHTDHVAGLDELRCFNFAQRSPIPVYGNQWTWEEVQKRFDYIFKKNPVEGGGIPQINMHLIDFKEYYFNIGRLRITPIELEHGSKPCLGFRIKNIAYLTDCSRIPPSSMDRLRGLDTLILDCVRLLPHGTHLNLDRALEVISELSPKRTFLTHLGHDFDYSKTMKRLPRRVALAYDGLVLRD